MSVSHFTLKPSNFRLKLLIGTSSTFYQRCIFGQGSHH